MFSIAHAQDSTSKFTPEIIIINDESLLKDDELFEEPLRFGKGKKPRYYVNGSEVYSIAYYNRAEIKQIEVLRAAAAKKKYGVKGRNGVLEVTLHDWIKQPVVKVTSNTLHYQYQVNEAYRDTTATFCAQYPERCRLHDLSDSTNKTVMYADFDNEVQVMHTGAGWDRVHVYVTGDIMTSGGNGRYICRAKAGGMSNFVVAINNIDNTTKEYTFPVTIKQLPMPKPYAKN